MTNIRRHLTFANAIAAIALFVALGGGAVAAIQSKSSAPKPRWAVVDTHGHLVREAARWRRSSSSLRTSAAHIR